jgi:CHAT domain-containing protein/tetratricopeptide (TPR) repeat protein
VLQVDFFPVNELTPVVKSFAEWTRALLIVGVIFSLLCESVRPAPAEMLSDQQKASLIEQASKLLREITELRQQKAWAKIFPLLHQYADLKQKVFGESDSEFADALFITGAIYRESGEAAKSIPYLRRALGIREQVFGTNAPSVMAAVTSLALAYRAAGDITAAIPWYERVLSIQEKSFGAEHTNLIAVLNTLGELHSSRGDTLRAMPLFERSLKLTEQIDGNASVRVAALLDRMGNIQQTLGAYAKAESFHQRSLAIREKGGAGNPADVATSLGNLGLVYRAEGKHDLALASIQRALAIREKELGSRDPRLSATLGNLAALYEDAGQFDQAMELHRKALALATDAFGLENQEVAICLSNLAECHRRRGDYAHAIELLRRALRVSESTLGTNHPQVAAILNNLASAEQDLGNYREAFQLYHRSLLIKESVFGLDSLEVALIANNIGEIFMATRDAQEASEWYDRSARISVKLLGMESDLVAMTMGNAGLARKALGRQKDALALLNESLAIKTRLWGNDSLHVALALNNLADLYQDDGNLSRARETYQRSLAITRKFLPDQHPDVMTRQNNLATVHQAEGNFGTSLSIFGNVTRSLREYLAGQLTAISDRDALRVLGLVSYRAAMLHSACAEATGKVPNVASVVGAEHLSLSKGLLEEIGVARSALEADLSESTAQLRNQFGQIQGQLTLVSKSDLPADQRAVRMRELQVESSRLEDQLAERLRVVAQTIRERRLNQTDVARSLPSQTVLIDLVLYVRFDFSAMTNSWKEVRYAAYLTFPLAKDSTNLVVERVDLGEAAPIDAAVETITRRMSAGEYRAKDLAAALQRVSELVYMPLARQLTNVSHLIVCPDGQLSRLPFEMLPVAPGGKYLIEEKTISYVGSGREVVRLAAGPKSKVQSPTSSAISKSVVMGNPDFDLDFGSARVPRAVADVSSATNGLEAGRFQQRAGGPRSLRSRELDARGMKFAPLPGAGDEARAVAGLLGADCVLRLGKEAREAELKAVQSPRVLHLATHGFFLSDQEFKRTNAPSWVWSPAFTRPGPPEGGTPNDWENPLVRCGIALAGANHATRITNAVAEDGLLTGLEASLLNLQGTELVILSACETGAGEVKIGEGVMSLRRAFRIAGAQTVLASHWKVSDKATSQLMTEFMRRWRGGTPRAQAWRETQLSLLRDKSGNDFSNPYFWAAFTLTGQWQ